MVHTAFFSAVMKRIEWENNVLSLTFNNDKVFNYYVPDEHVYHELCGSTSIGKYYAQHIKGKYQVIQKEVNYTTMIKMQVIGHLGKDAVVKDVNGKKVINFTVAHSERYKNAAGEQKENTIWVDCAYWNDSAAVAPYLVKGTLVYAEGIPTAEAYLKEGEAKGTQRLRVISVQLLGSKSENAPAATTAGTAQQQQQAPPAQAATKTAAPAADDLPF